MTVVWVLDTDHLSLLQREHPTVKQRINQINFANTAIIVVTLEEQMKGWLNVINKYNDQPDQSEKLILAYSSFVVKPAGTKINLESCFFIWENKLT